MRPYELVQPKYAFWFEVGQRLGIMVQSIVADALCADTHHVPRSSLMKGEEEIIKEIAVRRGILLFIN